MKRNDFVLLLFFIFTFILIRTFYFQNLFQFIYDQVSSSAIAMQLWRNKELTLIGPPMSLTIENKQIFFGGISYYIQLFFLLLANFDPFWGTYNFMLFAALMLIPLYIGTKMLINKNAAILMCCIYTLLPFYIEGTTALWNPYFQLSLLPLLIYMMAHFEKKENKLLFFLIGVMNGILFQLHYQFLIVMIGLAIYYIWKKKLSWQYSLLGIAGFAIGVGNLILFEVRNNFYMTQTLLLFLKHRDKIGQHQMADYYVMSVVFFGLLAVLPFLKKYLTWKINLGIFLILFIVAIRFTTIDTDRRIYPPKWYYEDDQAVYQIIKYNYEEKNIRDFNVFEFYSATADTQKYYMKRDNLKINYDDYKQNKYLYVVFKDESFFKDVAYEVNTFQPSRLIRKWKINDTYNLYLLKRGH